MKSSVFTALAYITPALCVAFNNPPLNLYDYQLGTDLIDFLTSLEAADLADDSPSSPPKVGIFHSEVPNFFLWWFDYNPFVPDASSFNQTYLGRLFHDAVTAVKLLRSLPVIFMAEIDGRAASLGQESLMQCDMTFVGPNTILGQPKATVGDSAGNSGNQYLVRALGMQRASEYLLSVTPVRDAGAEMLGWVNQAFLTLDALTDYVDGLVERIIHVNAAVLNINKTSKFWAV